MDTIYKYPLRIIDAQEVEMPRGAKILSAQMQEEFLCLWALVEITKEKETRTIVIHGTGHPVYNVSDKKFIGTVQQGPLVWHVFEIQVQP
jgi:hypothetical protein